MVKLHTVAQLRNRAGLLRAMAEDTPRAGDKEALRRAADACDADADQLEQELRKPDRKD